MGSLSEPLVSVGNGHSPCLVNKTQKPLLIEGARDVSLEGHRVNNGKNCFTQDLFPSIFFHEQNKDG